MNRSDLNRNAYMLYGPLARRGYMRWWHSFIGIAPGTGDRRTFFIEYFIINPSPGGTQPILGQHPYFKKRCMKPSYVMIKAGAFPGAAPPSPTEDNRECKTVYQGRQLHAFYPISALKVALDPLYIQVEDCFYSENHIAGFVNATEEDARHRSFMTDAGYMEWDLKVHKSIACHTGRHAGPLFSSLNVFDSFWHGEGIRTSYSGTVTLDGITYEVSPESSYGYADKHWGRSYNRPWLQLASCHLISNRTGKPLKHSAFAVDGCCPRFLCFPLKPRLTLQLTYTGEDFTFFFAKPGKFSRSRWQVKETTKRFIWHIKARDKNTLLKLSLSCPKKSMLPLEYEAPDGTKAKEPLHCGSQGMGTMELYRLTPQGPQLLDTLIILDALCEYQRS